MFLCSTGNPQLDAAFDLAFAESVAGNDAKALRMALSAICDTPVPAEQESAKRQVVADMRAEIALIDGER